MTLARGAKNQWGNIVEPLSLRQLGVNSRNGYDRSER